MYPVQDSFELHLRHFKGNHSIRSYLLKDSDFALILIMKIQRAYASLPTHLSLLSAEASEDVFDAEGTSSDFLHVLDLE